MGVAVASSIVLGLVSVDTAYTFSVRPALQNVRLASGAQASLVWPSTGTAAVYVPGSDFSASMNNDVVPIASVTKLMTAYVMLQALPLTATSTGPCWTVTTSDAELYTSDADTDQSSVKVVPGEQLCENQILEGMMIHSASNFANMAVELVNTEAPTSLGLSTPQAFLSAMNADASALGMANTTYVDFSGFDPGNVSSASDVLRLTAVLMQNAYFRSVVSMTSVALPVAGVVGTYTPELGTQGVVGVKSGRTSSAGGCDVMARQFVVRGRITTVYVAVFGQTGPDVIASAGEAALALSTSVVSAMKNSIVRRGTVVGSIGWGADRAPLVTKDGVSIKWWQLTNNVRMTVVLSRSGNSFSHGRTVGYLVVRARRTYRIAVTVNHSVSAPTLWQRIR